MSVIEDLFFASKGQPVVYKGNTIHMVDFFGLEHSTSVSFTFEQCAGEWRQGALLRSDGRFTIGERTVDSAIAVWEDTAPRSFDIGVDVSDGLIEVRNIWDTGNGVIESWHNAAAMIIELLDNGKRYRCNDGYNDDDFNDIIFSIRRKN